jgi:hypothetical protein
MLSNLFLWFGQHFKLFVVLLVQNWPHFRPDFHEQVKLISSHFYERLETLELCNVQGIIDNRICNFVL